MLLKVDDSVSDAGSSSSRTAVIHCQQGESLWLKTESGSAFYGDNFLSTTFAGFLLFPG